MSIQISLKIRNHLKSGELSLDLANMDLSSIPSEISKCQETKKLMLSDNQITKIPAWISSLTKLEFIDLSNNQIE